MARIRNVTGQPRRQLTEGWQVACGTPEIAHPAQCAGLDWIAAPVPGTVAEALDAAGLATPEVLADLQARSFWYRTRLAGRGPATLRFEGLAGLCDIYLDGACIAVAQSMFVPVVCPVVLHPGSELYLHFKPLNAETLPKPARRQRWRPHLIADAHMRQARMTLLGHMPGWCPPVQPVGPYRPVEIIETSALRPGTAHVETRLENGVGIVTLTIEMVGAQGPVRARCAGVEIDLARITETRVGGEIRVNDPALWWPHSHGTPALHELTVHAGGSVIALGRIGFRTIEVDAGADGNGFALKVNGVAVFCRGANWTTPDLKRLPSTRSDYAPLLRRAREAGMNMLRIPGIMCLEGDAFFDLCDELGILVWVDLPLANFDYDFDDPAFRNGILAEVAHLIDRTQTAPSLAVICGGSEIAQQAAMLSLPEKLWRQPFLDNDLPQAVAAWRHDAVVVPNSPWGGDLPFSVNAGVSHYFGVGAYRRPLEDARRAGVRFASECLAFAQMPQPERMPTDAPPGSAVWKQMVVRDLKADWDFEDVRDAYLEQLYGVDAARLRAAQPARYVMLSAAVTGEVMEATYAEWRRSGSVTAGALVWFLADVAPGFGWGVLDDEAMPKPAYFALKRAFRPVQVILTDEGVNGLDVHVINERAAPRRLTLALTCYGDDGATVIDGAETLVVPPHSVLRRNASGLFGVFFDVTYAYRFGPPAHALTVARLSDAETGDRIAEAFHFPHGRGHGLDRLGLLAGLERDAAGWRLDLVTARPAQSVHLHVPGFEPEDDWFHLAPGIIRQVRLKGEGVPRGHAVALNGHDRARF